ncbi:HD-GYP domain-containing protein [bacterium]|nr:HD-GYP domain-containing protein [bacterium]
MDTSVTNVVAEFDEDVFVPVERLSAGLVVDSDLFADNQKLISKGTVLSQSIISNLTSRGIEQLKVRRGSSLARLGIMPESAEDRFAALLVDTGRIYEKHDLSMVIPQEKLESASHQIETFFCDLELGQSVDLTKMRGTVDGLIREFTKNPNGAVKLLDLEHFDRYTYRHSINVGLLFLLNVADWVDDEDELAEMVYGAVMHDIGKSRVDLSILNKPGPLDREEWEIMKMHPVWSSELLEDTAISDTGMRIARAHHEKLDGSGYPDGRNASQIDRFVRLSTICDVYDAITTKRSYKNKMNFAKAIEIIIQGCGPQFDPKIANMFIRKVGQYPIGTFVRLSDGRVGVVTSVNEAAITRPVVSIVLDQQLKETDSPEELDLSELPGIRIVGVVAGKSEETSDRPRANS